MYMQVPFKDTDTSSTSRANMGTTVVSLPKPKLILCRPRELRLDSVTNFGEFELGGSQENSK